MPGRDAPLPLPAGCRPPSGRSQPAGARRATLRDRRVGGSVAARTARRGKDASARRAARPRGGGDTRARRADRPSSSGEARPQGGETETERSADRAAPAREAAPRVQDDRCEVLPPVDSFVVRRLMKILFLGRHFTYFRNFESVLRELAARGHQIHLAVEQDESLGGTKLVNGLVEEFPNVTAGVLPERPEDDWTWTATRLRLGLDHLRYQHPVFDRASKLR